MKFFCSEKIKSGEQTEHGFQGPLTSKCKISNCHLVAKRACIRHFSSLNSLMSSIMTRRFPIWISLKNK